MSLLNSNSLLIHPQWNCVQLNSHSILFTAVKNHNALLEILWSMPSLCLILLYFVCTSGSNASKLSTQPRGYQGNVKVSKHLPHKENILHPWNCPDHHCIIFNLLATDFFFPNFSTPVFKMWVIQKPNRVALWNTRHFEEEKTEIIQHV